MDRRQMLAASLGGATLAAFGTGIATAATAGPSPLPRRDRIRVAFMLGRGANVVDTTGPWEVFQDVMLPGSDHRHPFELYTVAASRHLVEMTGGLKVAPHYTIANAPQPHVIVVPAQASNRAMHAWLAKAAAGADVTMSVCTGAFQLARAGLLKDHAATTHHQFWDSFAAEFPDIELRRGLRFVDSGRIATAGGLTSGFDMALHVVSRYFGDVVAETTARYLEHDSQGWRTGARA